MIAAVLGGALTACTPRDPAATLVAPTRDPALATDPINATEVAALHRHAEHVLAELIAALPDRHRARVADMTLIRDNALGDVNAYATCTPDGPIVAVSDGLLTIAAHLAMGTATDELYETDTARAYLGWLATRGLTPPPVHFYAAAYHTDRRKVLRQHEVFDEQLAFILGHELAHHYLGHLPCTGASVLDELGRAATEIPVFNQAAELAADTAAIKNLLAAGVQRDGYAWTEDGALLVIAAFNRHHATTAKDVFHAFERSHPFPHLRAPAITLAAEMWHSSGGYLPLVL